MSNKLLCCLEGRIDPLKSWNKKGNVYYLKPFDYEPGQGTGFLPGELFPGLIELEDKTYIPIHDHRGCIITLLDPEIHEAFETYRYTAFWRRSYLRDAFSLEICK